MIVYFDTSALVKVYVQEVGSSDVRKQADQAESVATSRIVPARKEGLKVA